MAQCFLYAERKGSVRTTIPAAAGSEGDGGGCTGSRQWSETSWFWQFLTVLYQSVCSVSSCYSFTRTAVGLFESCASSLFRNGRAVQWEMIKEVEKGTWDERLKKKKSVWRRERWGAGLTVFKCLRSECKKEGDQVHIRKEKVGLDYSFEDLVGN